MDALNGEMTKKESLITKCYALSRPPTLPPMLSQPLSLVTSLPFIRVSVLNNDHPPQILSPGPIFLLATHVPQTP